MYINIDTKQILNINNESDLQQSVVKYLRKADLLFIVNQGEFLDTIHKRVEATKLGYTKGSVDLMILTPCGGYSGLAFEFKSPTGFGNIMKEQRGFMEILEHECNYLCVFSNDYAEIIEIVIKYVNDLL